jgi:hypothetical protein
VANRQISAKDPGTSADFLVTTPGGGRIAAGNDRFRHLNELDNESDIFKLRADWQVGDHLLTGGFEREEYTVRNLFTPGSRGWFRFSSIADMENQVIGEGDVLYGNANIPSGDPLFSEANFSLAVDSFYIQDEWTPTDALTLKFGVRFDTYSNNDAIPNNDVITQRYGFANTENLDGKDLTLPRIGFDYVVNDRLTFRGGVGLFGGGAPLIMLSNSYAGNGITRTFLARFFDDPGTPLTNAAIQQTLLDLPTNPETAAFDNLQVFIGAGVASNQNIDFLDPDFDILSMWKYSIGAEFVLGDEWILSADILFSDVNDGYDISELRRSQIDTAPDGRPIYTSDFDGGDYMVTNTSEGSGTVVTLGLEKTYDTNAGTFTLNGGYTFQDIDETRSYNRFVSFESYAFDPQTDLENPSLAPSRFEVEHRVTANMIWQNQWFGDNTTTIGLTYAGRSGRHFSYVFGSNFTDTFGGSSLAEFFSEGDNPGAHLFYVPEEGGDSIVTGDAAFLSDLDSFISSDDCLRGKRGTVVGRNACETDWVNIFSLRLAQEIKVGNSAFDIFLDIANIGNLLNSDWGRIDSYTAPSNVAPVNVAIDSSGPTPVYEYTSGASYQGTPDTVVSRPSIARIASVYRLQFGLKFRF